MPHGDASLPRFSGAVLAGGQSKRFGCDKCLYAYQGKRLLDHALASLGPAAQRFVVGRETDVEESAIWIRDAIQGKGAAGGLHAALEASAHDWVALVGCDMPFLPASLWAHLFQHREDAWVVVPESESGLEPLAAIYHRALLPTLTERLDGGAFPIRWLLKDVPSRVVPWEELAAHLPENAFLNANRPEDLP